MNRGVFGDWRFGTEHLAFAPRAAFAVITGTPRDQRAADALPRLIGRDVLLVVPASDAALTREMEAMFATIPEQRDSDGNLVMLPSTRQDQLYGEDLEMYENRVASFLWARLVGV